MDNNSSNVALMPVTEQLRLARLLLIQYETWHPFLDTQMQNYTVACCNIALPGQVKLDVGAKTIIYDIKTEKNYKLVKPGHLAKHINKKISKAKYKKEVALAKTNLNSWTKELLWGEGTTVRIYIDGLEIE